MLMSDDTALLTGHEKDLSELISNRNEDYYQEDQGILQTIEHIMDGKYYQRGSILRRPGTGRSNIVLLSIQDEDITNIVI